MKLMAFPALVLKNSVIKMPTMCLLKHLYSRSIPDFETGLGAVIAEHDLIGVQIVQSTDVKSFSSNILSRSISRTTFDLTIEDKGFGIDDRRNCKIQ